MHECRYLVFHQGSYVGSIIDAKSPELTIALKCDCSSLERRVQISSASSKSTCCSLCSRSGIESASSESTRRSKSRWDEATDRRREAKLEHRRITYLRCIVRHLTRRILLAFATFDYDRWARHLASSIAFRRTSCRITRSTRDETVTDNKTANNTAAGISGTYI